MCIGKKELGKQINIDHTGMYSIENVKRNIRLSNALKYLDALGHNIIISNSTSSFIIYHTDDFGSWLKSHRGEYTKYRLQKETGVTTTAISKIEEHRGLDPTIETVIKLTETLGYQIKIVENQILPITPQDCIDFLDNYIDEIKDTAETYDREIISTIKNIIKQK